MTDDREPTPSGRDEIPDAVLRELRTVFADPEDGLLADDSGAVDGGPPTSPTPPPVRSPRRAESSADAIDFDDPSVDAMLGISPAPAAQESHDVTVAPGHVGSTALVAGEPAPEPAPEPSRRERRRLRKAEREAAKAADDAAKAAAKAAKHADRAAAEAERQRAKDDERATRRKGGKGRMGRKGRKDGGAVFDLADAVDTVRLIPATRPGDAAVDPDVESDPDAIPLAPAEPAMTILIGHDDELPDAVYLDAAAEERLRDVHGTPEPARSGGSMIVIGDELDSSGAFDAVEVPTRSMDPRVRARRIAVKRAAGKRRLLWVAAAALVIILIVGTLAVFSSSLFAVEDVRVQGATYTEFYDDAALQAVVEDLTGEPILLVDTLEAERRLELIPWIERAIVTTDFPHSVMIDVRERQPLAAFQGTLDGRYRIIDREGRVLDVIDGRPADYMLITGQAPDVERGALAGAPWAAAAQLVAALPSEIRNITTSASVDAGTGDLGLQLQPAVTVRLGGFAGVDAKLARLLQAVRDGLLGIVSIDVSTAEVSVTRG